MAFGIFCNGCHLDACDFERFTTIQATVEALVQVSHQGGWLLLKDDTLLCPECAANPPDLS